MSIPRRRGWFLASLLLLAAPTDLPAASPLQSTQGDGAPDRVDLLSWGAGAFVVQMDPPTTNNTIRNAVDGSERTLGIGIPRREPLPHRFVVELPALTTFDTFGVPVMNEFGPARGRHVGVIRIEGSTEGPDSGFSPLATLSLELGHTAPQLFPVADSRPVRWVRVEFVSRLIEAPTDTDEHTFSELLGYGTQQPIIVTFDRFTGRWRLRRTGINDLPGTNTIELVQVGMEIRGCEIAGGRPSTITGTIVDGLAQLLFYPEGAPAPVPVLASVTDAGELVGARFSAGYSDFWASPATIDGRSCPDRPEAPYRFLDALEAGEAVVIHGINFDLDSDRLRPDATPALEQVLAALQAAGTLAVTIEGHTDWDGSEAHNLDLSQRRAEAVVSWLTERGIAVERLRPVGAGESRPIADNESSAGRALNRRVEIQPN